ncbi:LysR family transcriptional regulator [Arthrobacter sp. NPDC090010]|uniref:LysR family transcriptional regulator n=1 Tax=Arthrobacter sp. NPDC090010 TaxID=3363942 RepID=UPI0037F41FAB
MIDVLSLRALIAVADTGSVTAAATLLNYTPSNITQHIRRLERTVQCPLLERVGRGVVPTEYARSLVERGRPIVLALDDLAAAHDGEPAGQVRIGVFPTALRGLVIPAVAALASAHPSLAVQPLELEPDEALLFVRTGLTEAAVVKSWGRLAEEVPDDELQRISLGVDRIDAILPSSHPLADRPGLSMEQLRHEPWAVTPDDGPYRQWIEAQGGLGSPSGPAYQAAEFQSIMQYISLGLAVGAVPRLGRGPLPPGVVAVPLTGDSSFREVSLLLRTAASNGPNLRAVVQEIQCQASMYLETP